MKKYFVYLCFVMFMLVSVIPIFAADEEADDSIGATIREFLGCPGGEKKCFTGKVTIKGVEIEGTWYLE